MPAILAMASVVVLKGSVMTTTAGMPRVSKVMASSKLLDEQDPQSPMAVITAVQLPASLSASLLLIGAFKSPFEMRTTSPI